MQATSPLDWIPLWLVVVLTILLVVVSIEGGYQIGRRRRARIPDEKEGPIGAIVGAALGLLGFLLVFTFSLAASRFQDRRVIIIDEDNAIGTCYLRAGLLPDGRGVTSRKLLREYVEGRLRVIESRDFAGHLKRSNEIHHQLWKEAESVGRDHPQSIVVGLFIESVNETIDIHSRRVLISLQSRLPTPVWSSLVLATFLTMAGVGYHEGMSNSRRTPATFVLVLTFSIIASLIADLDRPLEGLMRVSSQATNELRDSMNQER